MINILEEFSSCKFRFLCCRQCRRQHSRSGDIAIVDSNRLFAIRHKTVDRDDVADDLRGKNSSVHESSQGGTPYLEQSAAAHMAVSRTLDLQGRQHEVLQG